MQRFLYSYVARVGFLGIRWLPRCRKRNGRLDTKLLFEEVTLLAKDDSSSLLCDASDFGITNSACVINIKPSVYLRYSQYSRRLNDSFIIRCSN